MTFYFPHSIFAFRRILSAYAVLFCAFFVALSLNASPLLIKTEPGTEVVFRAQTGGDPVALGVADADGILLATAAPETAGTLTLTHPDAVDVLEIAFVPGKTPDKLASALKLRPATLMVSAQPTGEVEIFINGEHRGRGAVTVGGLAPRQKITVEARTARRGMQSRVVSLLPGEMQTVKFDLRGNDISARPAGQIVLPELPLVLASQNGAIVKVDGAMIDLEGGVLRGIEPGERIVEIFLPWRGREVCVWRAAVPARSAMLPGADVPASPNPVRTDDSAEKPALADVPAPAEKSVPAAVVSFVIGRNVTVSLGSKDGLVDGTKAQVLFGAAETPVEVEVFGVSQDQSTLRLPENVAVPAENSAVRLAPASR